MLEGERPGDSFLFRCGEGSVSGGEEGSDVVYRGGGVEVGAQETFWVGGTVRGGEAIHVVTAGGRGHQFEVLEGRTLRLTGTMRSRPHRPSLSDCSEAWRTEERRISTRDGSPGVV